MNPFRAFICFLLLGSIGVLHAQEVTAEVVIPTEISEPPYEVGDLISEQGYTITKDDGSFINFRIVANKIRIYWLDENKLIMEPPAVAATVRFTGSVRGSPYHRALPLEGDVGLGAPGVVPPPHSWNVILSIQNSEAEDDYTTYNFRYVPAMDQAKES